MRKSAAHLCVLGRNYGDNALNYSIRRMLRKSFRIKHIDLLKDPFNKSNMKRVRRSKVIIFGGGGLIHSYGPTGRPWVKTGTMWDMDLRTIESLKAKIVLYGVGFNHFFGDPKPLPRMGDFFRLLIRKRAIIAFRNDGSKERFGEFFPELVDAVEVIPDPGLFYRPKPRFFSARKEYIVLQVAADRLIMRYGRRYNEFIEILISLCRLASKQIILIPHTPDDAKLYEDLAHQLPVKVEPLNLTASGTKRVFQLYAGAQFTISTRGHSQICSIGNGVPTFTIGTHPKVLAFAQNSGLGSCCIDFRYEDPQMIVHRFKTFLERLETIKSNLVGLNLRFDDEIDRFNKRLKTMVQAEVKI